MYACMRDITNVFSMYECMHACMYACMYVCIFVRMSLIGLGTYTYSQLWLLSCLRQQCFYITM